MKNARYGGIAAAVLGMFLVLAAGCGGKVEEKVSNKLTEKAIESAVNQNGANMNVKVAQDGDGKAVTIQGTDENGQKVSMTMGQDGQGMNLSMEGSDGKMQMVSGDNARIPEDFPKDVPVYPGMKLDMAQSMGDGKSFTVVATSADSMAKLSEYYRKEAATQGWTEQMNMTQPDMVMLSYQKDGRTLGVSISKEDDKSRLSLSIAAQ